MGGPEVSSQVLLQTCACSSSGCGRYQAIKAAFVPERSVSSTAHVVARGQSSGRVRGRIMDDHGVCFLYASQEPPLACVSRAGIRASGRGSGVDGAFAG